MGTRVVRKATRPVPPVEPAAGTPAVEPPRIPATCWMYGCTRPPTTAVPCSVPSPRRFVDVWICDHHAASLKGGASAKNGR